MKRSLMVCVMIAAAGCGQKEDKNVAAATADQSTRTADGVVVIPPDSPELQQLHVEPVRTAQVPTDEVISPGKIEANPGPGAPKHKLLRLLDWREGHFEFSPCAITGHDEIMTSVTSLLLEHARRRDEESAPHRVPR